MENAKGPDGYVIREVDALDAAAMVRIGQLRVEVWAGEGTLGDELRERGVWLDDFDRVGRHWLAESAAGDVVAAGRLTVHEEPRASPDGYVWLDAGRPLAGPVANIAKLIV